MKPLKTAILSLTHGHTRKYYQTLRENPRLQWVAAQADNPEVKRIYEANPNCVGVPCYDTAEALFTAHPDVEAVVLASANVDHCRQVEDCARRGLHILSMKIPTFDMAEYDRMIAAVDKAGVVCQIELELHHNPVVHRLKRLIADGAIGRIHSIQATNITLSPVWAFPWQGIPETSYGRAVPLRPGDRRFRGGALSDHPHIFDLVRWLTGSDIGFVYAEAAPNIRPDLRVEDMLLVNGKMANGTIFLLDPSWSRMEERLPVPGPGWEVFPKRMEVNLTISGDAGVLVADCFGPNVYHNGGPKDRYTVQYTYFDEWVGLMEEFCTCVRERRSPSIDLRWHRQSIAAMNACYDAISTGDAQAVA